VSRDSRAVLTAPARAPDFTVRYGDEPDHVADVRLPGAAGPPLVVFLHGGFWRDAWDRGHTGPLAAALADAGFAVATPEYRRVGPRGVPLGWPYTFDDVRLAVREVPLLVAGRAEVDLDRVVLAGHSAGGHLALWAAGATEVPTRIHAIVALAPVADLRAAYQLDLDGGAVAALLGGGPEDVPDRYAATDPMARPPVGTPTVLVHGARDRQVPVTLSRRYAEVAGARARLVDLPDADHFQVIDPQSPVWPDVVDAFREAAALT
jgi:acetyl esterase/lipase